MLEPMGEPAARVRVEYATYVALERDAQQKHEWFDGEIFAMAGGTIVHGQLAAAMTVALGLLAQKCGCRVFSSDVKIRVQKTELATYPDVSVVCGPLERDPDDPHALTNPALLVEVLSDGTEGYDRGAKFSNYREIPSLRDYVLVSQHERLVEVFSRDAQGLWVLREARAGGSVPLSALGGSLSVDGVYEGVELEPRALRA